MKLAHSTGCGLQQTFVDIDLVVLMLAHVYMGRWDYSRIGIAVG